MLHGPIVSKDVYVLAEYPEFLLIAKIILVDCGHLLTDMQVKYKAYLRISNF